MSRKNQDVLVDLNERIARVLPVEWRIKQSQVYKTRSRPNARVAGTIARRVDAFDDPDHAQPCLHL